ncbi:S41 family peptidase [Nonlabens dokdonensis]|uniref:Tricorn protease homolog n=2 Tax=Nonlabens dokdonensis TaxID=328515 RepID=L7W5R4_NONDD|nr:S41 family peptidase [Nonlabens dokdonensis]AGC75439.1 peptidase S41 [Nonlabens dokdonensis DSW-6]
MKHLLIITVFLSGMIASSQGTQLLRQPTIHKDQVVFSYANDLWQASTNGGNAKRLTSNIGGEMSPQFSPDGKMIAFTAEYDGNFDVYVIPASGGEPERMTFHPSGDFVQGWTPDNKIIFRSNRASKPTQSNHLYTIGVNEHFPNQIEIGRAAFGNISQDGKHIAYTPITSWDAEWRNYRGGQALPIWIVNLKTKELQTTPQLDQERHLSPVWHNDMVYYISERDYTSNIWSYNPKTKTEKQITFHKIFDVKNIDTDHNNIVYEQGGYLHLLNPSTGATNKIIINVQADYNFARERWNEVSAWNLTNPNVSPNGKRVLFEHRGEIFTVPKDNGTWRNISNSTAAAERSPIWSPKGDQIAWFSDESGEYQVIITDQYGENKKSIAIDNPTFFFTPDWSPDGKYLSFTDTDFNAYVLDIATGKAQIIATDNFAHPNRTLNPVWSPDSKWVAYSKQLKSHFKAIFVYNVETKKTIQITDPIADSISPVWDESGDYIYTLSSTDYGLTSGWLDMSSMDKTVNRSLYAVVLASDGKAPHLPETDEEAIKKEDADKKEEKKDDKKDAEDAAVTIDEEGIFERIIPMQLPTRNYPALAKGPSGTVFIAEAIPNENGLKVHKYNVKEQEAKEFASGVNSMVSSYDGNHLLLFKSGSWSLNDAKKPTAGKETLDTSMKVKVNPQEEYAQIFKEGWRYMRDFLYVDNTHGAPWDQVYEWYAPWIKHVRHRVDLNYVVDIMSGEIAIGHSYVSGGDFPDTNRVPVGLLGADLSINKGMYQIDKIYTGETWNPVITGPLSLPGINVKEGDYIHSINGAALSENVNPYQLLEQTANRTIRLTVSSTGKEKDAHTVIIKPVRSERRLRNVEWIEDNRRRVDQLSGGKLAYVYVPNTGGGGFESFNRYYFSQQDKKGVIIDERNNGGGSAADYMIDIMNREPMGYFNSKANDNRPWTTPMAGIFGPKVMIINERAGSGGDLLPYMFKQQDIGPIVGTRTWGGLVGTWDTPPFVDGGRMVAPRGGFFDLDGNWAVEGEGVAPDIEVIQDPKSIVAGNDPQLETAVQEALRLLPSQEFEMKPEPKAPVRWKKADGWNKK